MNSPSYIKPCYIKPSRSIRRTIVIRLGHVLPLVAVALTLCTGPACSQSNAPASTQPALLNDTQPNAPRPDKHALLIGVHAYSHPSDPTFPDLPGPVNDVAVIRHVLINKFRFPATQITVLTSPQDTTRASILKAIHTLIAGTHKGDIVYIHYSGHGSQVPDSTASEGVDSTLVPSDWVRHGTKDIRSREIAALLRQLDQMNPANVTLTFDCCNSGTISRGGHELVRGVDFATRYGTPPPGAKLALSEGISTSKGSYSAALPLIKVPGARGTGEAPPQYVVISACQDYQNALECEDSQHRKMGRLSYLLAQALTEAGPQTTSQDLYNRLNDWMGQRFPHDNQSPQIDGRERNLRILDGTAIPPQHFIPVRNDATGLRLMAGTVLGVTEGSVYALFSNPAVSTGGASQSAAKIAEARVGKVGATDAALKITLRLGPNLDLSGAGAIEVSHFYGENRLKVRPNDFLTLPHGADVAAQLATTPSINTDVRPGQEPDVMLERATPGWLKAHPETQDIRPGDYALVRGDGGSLLAKLLLTDDLASQIKTALDREAHWQMINQLNNDSSWSLPIQAKLIPATPPADGLTYRSDLPGTTPNPALIHETDWATLEITNNGVKDAYIVVLDLTSDGSYQQLWPRPYDNILNNFIPAGETRRLWEGSNIKRTALIKFMPPDVREIFKIVATDRHVDFDPLLDKGARRGPEDDSPLAQLLHSAVSGRRAGIPAPPKDWATATLTFTVAP